MLIPDPKSLKLVSCLANQQSMTLVVKAHPTTASCPECQQPSGRIHSRYRRTVADLPWQGLPVRLQLYSRKFFCENGDCPRAIFTERLPSVVAAYGRRTLRLQEVLHQLGLALGGQAGARMARRLGMTLSPDQLLRSLRRVSHPPRQGPRVLGVDEWAWKRGSRYGTILCDLEQRRVVDLLPDSHAQSFAHWLATHPGVEVVSRDRAGAYAEGASQGAPQAVQVADRWHLLRNLREALQRVVEREQAQLGRAAQSVAESRAATASSMSTSVEEKQDQGQAPRRLTRAQQQRRDRRWRRYSEALRLHEQGLSQVAIARQLSLSVRTLRRWSHAGRFPEWAQPRRKHRLLDSFVPYLAERWAAGCQNARQLWREIHQQGFTGSAGLVQRWAFQRRQLTPTDPQRSRPAVVTATPRQTTWLLLREPADLEPEQQRFLDAFKRLCPPIETAARLAREFWHLLREHDHAAFSEWLQKTEGTALSWFAAGLRRDEAAVRAALKLPWSNGPVEGHVHRLKLIKRQMYGRAKFDLLRARVLQAA